MAKDSRRRRLITAGLVASWAVAVGTGFALLLGYANAPGDAGTPASVRPGTDPGRALLILVAHPHCPCTRASIEELDRVLTRCRGAAHVRFLFFKPGTFPPGWERSDLWRRAAAIPGAEVLTDHDGAEARRLGVRTSGHALLFGADGRLLYSGGVTGSRGHAGDNPGADALRALLTGGPAVGTTAPVFGCSLEGPGTPGGTECDSCNP